MLFKSQHMKEQLNLADPQLIVVAADFVLLSKFFHVEPVVTRVSDEVKGSSGVHEVGRGIDFRDNHRRKYLYTPGQVELILNMLNLKYARNDGFKTAIWHQVSGSTAHFHLQVPDSLEKYVKHS